MVVNRLMSPEIRYESGLGKRWVSRC